MKLDRTIIYAVIFIAFIAAVAVIVWILQPPAASTGQAENERGFFSTLFPFGRSGSTQTTPLGDSDNTFDSGIVPELRKLSEEPVAGATYFRGSGGLLSVRYIERDTGHVYETPVSQSTQIRLTNSTIPAVHDSTWVNASTTLMRFLSDENGIQNFVGVIASSTADQDLTGGFLRNYSRVTVGTKDTLFGILETPTGSVAESFLPDGTGIKTVFTSPLQSWIPHASFGKFYLASAPSGRNFGSVYEVKNGNLERVIPPRTGLQALFQKEGSLVAVTGGAQNSLTLAMYDLQNGGMLEIPVGTLVQKCAWATGRTTMLVCAVPRNLPQSMYPDVWLLGLVHTDDDIYEINTDTGAITRVFNLSESGSGPFDVTQAMLSDDGAYFLFVNRNDQTLWSAKLSPEI